jgi:hypothetical protein
LVTTSGAGMIYSVAYTGILNPNVCSVRIIYGLPVATRFMIPMYACHEISVTFAVVLVVTWRFGFVKFSIVWCNQNFGWEMPKLRVPTVL